MLFPEQTAVVSKATLCIWIILIYYLNRVLVLEKYKLKFNSMDIENLAASGK